MLLYTLAGLKPEQLAKLQAWEAKTGKVLLALSWHPVNLAELSQEEMETLQELEAELRVALIAVQ